MGFVVDIMDLMLTSSRNKIIIKINKKIKINELTISYLIIENNDTRYKLNMFF